MIYPSIRDRISFGFARITGSKDSNTAITTTPLPIPNSNAISVNCKETCRETPVSTEDSNSSVRLVSNGNIAGRGTQEELLRECPIYQKMWQDYAGTIEEADMKGGVENHA